MSDCVGLVAGRCDYVNMGDGCKANSVKLFKFDMEKGEGVEVGEVQTGANPSWVLVDGGVIYCTNETVPKGRVEAVDVATGEKVSTVVGGAPCHLHLDSATRHLYSANYCGGDVTSFTVNRGLLLVESTLSPGTNPTDEALHDRQEAPHPHHVTPTPHGLAVSDLGTDRVDFFPLKEGIPCPPATTLHLHQGAGPRRILCAGGYIYVLNELTQGITVAKQDTLEVQGEEVPLLPSTVAPLRWHHRGASEIALSPCGKYIIAATRTSNELVVFSRDVAKGGLTFHSRVSSGGTTPRHIVFRGSWLFASCHIISHDLLEADKQVTDRIAVFKFTDGTLTHHTDIPCEMAACVDFIDAKYL